MRKYNFTVLLNEVERIIKDLLPGSPKWAVVFLTTEETYMSSASVADTFEGEISAGVTFLDSHGHETTPDDTPQWSSDNENVASVSASEDGLTGTVTISGTPGAAVISVDTTNEDGSSVHSQGTLTVLPGDAVSGDITFEVPEEAAPPAEGDLPHPDNTLPGDLPQE